MEHAVIDPNRSDRRSYFALGGFLCGLALVLPFTNPLLPLVGLVALFGGLTIVGVGVISRPYVVLDCSGVTWRLLFRKKFYRWNEGLQVGIRNTGATSVPVEYRFPIVIVFPSQKRWQRRRFAKDIFCSALIPSRPEIRKFIATHYGSLDFDDTNGLSNWEKQYYGFKKKP